VRRAFGVPLRELLDFARAIALLRRARRQVLSGDGALARSLEPDGDKRHDLSGTEMERISERATKAVSRAGRYAPFDSTCLMRALALREMLKRRGVHDATVRVGVRWEGLGFEAHAWVERGNLVLGSDALQVSSYSPLDGLTMHL
jgi:hypothetical protein